MPVWQNSVSNFGVAVKKQVASFLETLFTEHKSTSMAIAHFTQYNITYSHRRQKQLISKVGPQYQDIEGVKALASKG